MSFVRRKALGDITAAFGLSIVAFPLTLSPWLTNIS
jgi:hypothetical protein